ncbi:MAG: polysaccharide biosynthesis tyrosine autokinase [Endomicrobiales bacterium]|nr:polysaccharide biosynthesis tyrosine autokinase [Endomicrobiales bacterium]
MAQYELSIQDYWRIIKRRRWIIFFTLIAVLGSVIIFTNLQTQIYQAMATVKVEPNLAIPGVATEMFDVYTAMNTEVKIIKSAVVAELAAKKLGLVSSSSSEGERQGIVSGIQGKINAERVGDTNLINIFAISSDPSETAKLANTMAEVYIQKGIEDRSRRARELREFIEIQVSDAEMKLKKSEDKLRKYTEQSGAKGIGGFLSQRLMDLENKKSELLKKYTEQHPEIQKIRQQTENIENEMRQLPAEELEYARLSREVKINEELYTLLAKRFKEAQISEADRVQSAFIVTPALEPTYPIKPNKTMNMSLGLFLGIFVGFVLALVIENLDTSIGTIEDVEKYLELPVLGIIPHVETEARAIPVIRGRQSRDQRVNTMRSRLTFFHEAKAPFVESYHTMLTNLKFAFSKEASGKAKILAITSAGIGEGKTLTASNFALTAAQSGIKTLLMEADLRRPTLHMLFGITRTPGLADSVLNNKSLKEIVKTTTDFLMGGIGTEQVLRSPGIENLSIITSGPSLQNPLEVLNSAQFKSIMKEITEQYELVIIDSPPVLLFADPMVTSAYATGTIIVYQVGRMARRALKRAKDQLTNVRMPVLGVVLNNVKTSDMGNYYGYGYSYYYSYKYYSRDGKEKESKT